MPTAEINSITINYRLEGPDSRDLVVLINGLADDLQTWDSQVPALHSAGFRTLRYDNRGVGKTSRPPGPYTSELLADDVHGLLDKLEVHTFHLLGVGMGGMVAQSYALKYPNGSSLAGGRRMLSLSLCCTYAQPTAFCSRVFALWADMAQQMGVPDVLRDATLWTYTVPFFKHKSEEAEQRDEAISASDVQVPEYLAQLNVLRKFDVMSALDGLTASGTILGGLEPRRVMVLAGKVSMLIPVTLSRELAEKIEGSEFVTVKGGFGCMWEFPEDFNKAIIEFLHKQAEAR